MTLEEFFRDNPRAALAFSGGTDSAFLLWAAARYGAQVRAYFVKTSFQPAFELRDAERLARELSMPMTVVEGDILAVPGAAENGPERCYHCKRALFTRLTEAARADGFSLLIDGTNASDDAGDRPGMRALRELSVCSPLRECGLTKEEVRRLSREAGLFTWNKPAYACLATRIPTGTRISRETLVSMCDYYSEDQLDAIYSGDQSQINEAFCGDLAYYNPSDGQLYSIYWLSDHTAADYQAAGVPVSEIERILDDASAMGDSYASLAEAAAPAAEAYALE